ncbi:MAG TPA: response regulator [Methanosarcinales archaeon]|nr:response regulator [Methanosarcinales archaeon]
MSEETSDATPVNVLLIEDDPGDAQMIREMLADSEETIFNMELADRLSTGLARIADGSGGDGVGDDNIDVILLDLSLPDSHGLDTFTSTYTQAPNVPIVVLNDLCDKELAIQAVQRGAQDCLLKGQVDGGTVVRAMRYAIERMRAMAHIEHLNSVLMAIRSVNQSIMVEKEREDLLRKACDALIEARGYDTAWIGLPAAEGEAFSTVVGSGFREDVSRFYMRMMDGDHPPCIREALGSDEFLAIVDRSVECKDCFLKDVCTGRAAAIIRVEHAGRFLGLLAISLTPEAAADEEEKELMMGVAGDIAVALHNIGLEEARKRAEEQIEASLKEKEVLLREIHHRVKNNLQIVSSLLNMQALIARDQDTVDVLSESRNRINAMALIHAQLYESKNLSEIDMRDFVDRLIGQLFQSYPVGDARIIPVIHVADHPFPISIALPAGLIINELLTNALRHAFSKGNDGQVEVTLSVSDSGKVSLTVSDNGVGVPEGFNMGESKTLGLRLVKILVEDQLQGNLRLISERGTTFNIEFET